MDAEPLVRALLNINEFLYGATDAKLLPGLKTLSDFYEARYKMHSLSASLNWMLKILDENEVEGFDRKQLLIKLARTEIELGKSKEAKETITRLEELA